MPERQNPPRLVVPRHDHDRAEARLLDVPLTGGLRRELDRVARDGLPTPRNIPAVVGGRRDGSALGNLLRVLSERGLVNDLSGLEDLIEPGIPIRANHVVSDSTVAFGTTLTTIVSTGLDDVLLPGVLYRLICLVHTRLSIDTTGFASAFARTQAGSSSVSGERTGTVNGERSCNAFATELVWGTGANVTMSARGQMSTATGFSSSALVVALALPIGRA